MCMLFKCTYFVQSQSKVNTRSHCEKYLHTFPTFKSPECQKVAVQFRSFLRKPMMMASSICQICMRTVKNKGGNTSNFAMHLRRNHPMQYATIFFSSTTDMWSSHGLLPYIGYTIHWIHSDWNLKSRNLGTRYDPENHTADNFVECMNDILSYWNLDETKPVAITTDNGANVKKACKDNSWTNVSCFGHNPLSSAEALRIF